MFVYRRGSRDAAFSPGFAAENYIKHSDIETKMEKAGWLHVGIFPYMTSSVISRLAGD